MLTMKIEFPAMTDPMVTAHYQQFTREAMRDFIYLYNQLVVTDELSLMDRHQQVSYIARLTVEKSMQKMQCSPVILASMVSSKKVFSELIDAMNKTRDNKPLTSKEDWIEYHEMIMFGFHFQLFHKILEFMGTLYKDFSARKQIHLVDANRYLSMFFKAAVKDKPTEKEIISQYA